MDIADAESSGGVGCETPKSPPGDYNLWSGYSHSGGSQSLCETPKSPPGDYNQPLLRYFNANITADTCETPKSPPGDYNITSHGDTLNGGNCMV
mgnify:CR=1 FL=1